MRTPTSPFRSTVSTAAVLAVGWSLVLVPADHHGTAVAAPRSDVAETTSTEVFVEDFERAPDGGSGISVRDYVGHADRRFDADDFWADRVACNGFILSPSIPDAEPGDCLDAPSALRNVRALAGVLGVLNGSEPTTNSAVAAYTQQNGPDDAIELETTTPITLAAASGRFLTASVDVAALNCFAPVAPALRLALRTPDGEEHPVSVDAIDPCTDPRAESITYDGVTADAGRFTGDSSLLVEAAAIDVVMRNAHGGGNGNDHAFDELSIIDVTPTVDLEFGQDTALVGEAVRLRFVVRNSPERAAKAGWSLQTTLPDGLSVAADPRAVAGCPAEVTAAASGKDVDVTGSLGSGDASCTIELDVTPDVRGPHRISLAEGTVRGLDLGSTSTLTAVAPIAITSPAPGSVVESARPVFEGSGEPGAEVVLRDADGRTLCETVVDDAGDWSCTSDVPATSGEATVTAEQSGSGRTVTTESSYRVLVPALGVAGTVTVETRDPDGSWRAAEAGIIEASSGDALRVVATIVNTGENPVGDITLTERPDTRLVCADSIVEPGTSTACTSTAPITLSPASLTDGSFVHEFEAVVTGYSRGPTSPPADTATSVTAERLPLPGTPHVSTGVLRTTLGVIWGAAPLAPQEPLAPQDPLARTGAEVPPGAALLIGGALVLGAILVGVGTRRAGRGGSSLS